MMDPENLSCHRQCFGIIDIFKYIPKFASYIFWNIRFIIHMVEWLVENR